MITFLLIFIISALPVPAAVARRGRPVPGRDVGLWALCPGACLEAAPALLLAGLASRRLSSLATNSSRTPPSQSRASA